MVVADPECPDGRSEVLGGRHRHRALRPCRVRQMEEVREYAAGDVFPTPLPPARAHGGDAEHLPNLHGGVDDAQAGIIEVLSDPLCGHQGFHVHHPFDD